MSVIFFAIRWLFLMALLWGVCISVRDFLNLKVGFAPVVAICGIGLLVYFGGLLGLLRPTTYLLILLCTASLIRILWRLKSTPFVWKGIPFIEGGFALGMLLFFGILYQGSLVHYDNFTHWALVVKEMLITHAFPTANSQLITFTNYPTGTASWIYFVCTIVGKGENMMIMAQGLMIFAAIYAIYGVIEERRRFLLTGILTTGLCLLTLFNFSVRINNLLVDFLLPVLTLASISIIHRYGLPFLRAQFPALIKPIRLFGDCGILSRDPSADAGILGTIWRRWHLRFVCTFILRKKQHHCWQKEFYRKMHCPLQLCQWGGNLSAFPSFLPLYPQKHRISFEIRCFF